MNYACEIKQVVLFVVTVPLFTTPPEPLQHQSMAIDELQKDAPSLESRPKPSPDMPPSKQEVEKMPELNSGAVSVPPPPYTAFSRTRKTFILSVTTIAGFFGPLAGNIYLPALPVLQQKFHVSLNAMNATVSVFMVVFAIGPLLWSSFADWKGRRPLYIASIGIYIVANILLAALPANFGALVFLRIVQAFGASAVVSMGAGTVADVTEPKNRGKAMSYFLLGPQCGPILGPVIGGLLAGETDWRWIFGFLALSAFVLWLLIIFCLPETLRCRVGNGSIYNDAGMILQPPRISSGLAPVSERGPPPPKPTLLGYWKMFCYPPIGIVSFNTAILYATYFSLAVKLPGALGDRYHWSTAEVGASYIPVGIAMIVGSMLGGRYSDWRRQTLVESKKEVIPETRLEDQIWGLLICSGGCLMFGWFVDKSIHPAAVLVATFITGFGMSWVFVGATAFLTECVPKQAAGAFSLGNLLRNPAAAIAAAIINPLVKKMGWGWCFTGLALLDLLVVGSLVILLRIRSPHWRKQRNVKESK